MTHLLQGEIADRVSEFQIMINNSAACEVVFTHRANGTVSHFFTDRRNPVNHHTIARWRAHVTAEFLATEKRVQMVA